MAFKYPSEKQRSRFAKSVEKVKSMELYKVCSPFMEVHGVSDITELLVAALINEDSSNLLGVVPLVYMADNIPTKIELRNDQLFIYFNKVILKFTVSYVDKIDVQQFRLTGESVKKRELFLKYNFATQQDFSAVELRERQVTESIQSYRRQLQETSIEEDL